MKDIKLNHIKGSLKIYKENKNKDNFEKIKIFPYSIPLYNLDEIDISTCILNKKIDIPIYINAMTGGSKHSLEINKKLFKIAKKLNLVLFLGSYSNGLKKIEENSYILDLLRNSNIVYGFNIGIDKSYLEIEKTFEETNSYFLQVHINTVQEYLQDKRFDITNYIKNFEVLSKINNSLIVKEVGFGMSKEMVDYVISKGVKCVDVSGKGGANFAKIENLYNKKLEKKYLENWGLSTVDSLIDNLENMKKIDILASGGIKTPLDVCKCLILGAKACGISSHILYLITKYSEDEVIKILEDFIFEIKLIMSMLGVKNLQDLRKVRYEIKE